MGRRRRKGPWWVEQVRVGPTKKLTLGLIASEQPRAPAFRTQPQMPHRALGATSSGHHPPLHAHLPLPQLPLMLASIPFLKTPTPSHRRISAPAAPLISGPGTQWVSKKCLVMSGEGKGPASPRGLSRDLGGVPQLPW